jgi:very-short-patch-repair endonuclease
MKPAAITFVESLQAEIESANERFDEVWRINHPGTLRNRYDALYAYYVKAWKHIKREPACDWAIDPYEVDWMSFFTPIESALWCDIREEGIVLYPQHPVAGYFVDFGHPKARVAIECDGRAYHTDKAKDKERQRAIEAKGWTVYRFTGSQCMQDFEEQDDWDTGGIKLVASEARQQLCSIARRHRLSRKYLEV